MCQTAKVISIHCYGTGGKELLYLCCFHWGGSPHFEGSGDFPESHGGSLPVAEPQCLGVLALIGYEAFAQQSPGNPDR
jgi:hypothetical protein